MSTEREAIEQAWQRAAGRCECQSGEHSHAAAGCGLPLTWINRGRHGAGAWEARRLFPEGGYQVLCWDCHAKDI